MWISEVVWIAMMILNFDVEAMIFGFTLFENLIVLDFEVHELLWE